MSKTIKQIAAELKIDKQKVYRYVRKNHINDVHQKNGMMWCSDAVETSIKQHFIENTASNDVHQNHIKITSSDAVVDAVVLMLKQELKEKNKLISDQQQTIRDLTVTLEKTADSLQAAQALHAGTMKKKLTADRAEPRNIFTRIFKRKQ